MRYCFARYKQQQRELAYRIYVTDSLNLIAQNKYMSTRYADIISEKPRDNRTGDEIAADIIKRAGLVVKND